MIDESVPVSELVIFIANIGYRNIGYFAYQCTSTKMHQINFVMFSSNCTPLWNLCVLLESFTW